MLLLLDAITHCCLEVKDYCVLWNITCTDIIRWIMIHVNVRYIRGIMSWLGLKLSYQSTLHKKGYECEQVLAGCRPQGWLPLGVDVASAVVCRHPLLFPGCHRQGRLPLAVDVAAAGCHHPLLFRSQGLLCSLKHNMHWYNSLDNDSCQCTLHKGNHVLVRS